MAIDTSALDALREQARTRFTALVATHGGAVRNQRTDVDGEYPAPLWEALAQDGLIGAYIPVEYGGLGLGLRGMAVVLEELAAADAGDMVPILSTMVAAPLVRHGTDALKREILPSIARGERRLAFAVTERAAGSNVFAAETQAVRDGDSYVLSGQKHYISAVDLADAILILARTTPRGPDAPPGQDGSDMAGFSLFLVDRESRGLTWERLTLPRLRSVCQYAVDLRDVRVPASRRVGPEGAAVFAVLDALNVERILIPALVLGATTWLLRLAVAHVNERRVFGDVPLGRYQAVQHPLAEVFLRTRGLRHLLDESTASYDDGANAFEVSLPTAAARFIAAEVADAALNAGSDAFGSRGFEADIGLLGFAQMVRLFRSAPVNTPVLLNFVAEHHLGLPRAS